MPKSFSAAVSPDLVQKGLLAICALAFVLVLLSRLLVPAVGLVSIGAACFILLVYALVFLRGPHFLEQVNPLLLRWMVRAGLLSGIVLGGEILLEYILVPRDNTPFGLVEYGSVLAIWFLVGLIVGYQTHLARQGVLVSVGAAMLGSLVWLIVLLSTYYLFRDTAVQAQLFRAEGTYEDFAHSGMSDFATFAMEDLLGACFFHLLLAPIIAAILGIIGGMIGKAASRIRKGTRINAD